MKENKIDYLKELTEEDIRVICDNVDLNVLLIPMKKNKNKKYSKDVSKLGRLDKKSTFVQKYLPKMAFDYYMKSDIEYYNIINGAANIFKNLFISKINKFKNEYENNIDIELFTIKEYKEFIVYTLLEDEDASIDLELFLLELKLNNIEISNTLKKEIEEQWTNIEEIVAIKKDCYKEYESKIKEIEAKFRKELKNKESEYKKENKNMEKEIKKLKNEIEEKENLVSDIKYQMQGLNNDVSDKCKCIESKDAKIEELLYKIDLMKNEIKDISEETNKSKNELYNIVRSEWEKSNKDKVEQLDYLTKYIQLSNEEIALLNEEKIKIKKQIDTWDSYVEEYINNLDLKVLDYKINSILLKKIDENSIGTNISKEKLVYDDSLYIQEGYIPDKIVECTDYEEYLDVVENNLSYCGVGRKVEYIYECFNASINSNLIPLICGYQSRKIAIALIASRFGEIPTIISIPGGYNNISSILKVIEESNTKTIIIEDAFGKMNEGVILPLLRKNQDKQIIFTAESMEDLGYLSKYYYNYLYLIKINDYSIPESDEIIYACGEKILKGQLFGKKSKGNKIARRILNNMNLDVPYIVSRGQVLNNLLLENADERNIVEYLFDSELKWIISEEYKDKFEDFFQLETETI